MKEIEQHTYVHDLHVADYCLKLAKLVLTANTDNIPHPYVLSHTASLTRGVFTVRWPDREGACCLSGCRLCSGHWSGRENCREK